MDVVPTRRGHGRPRHFFAFAAQETEPGAISPRELEVLKSETDEVLRELRNAPLTVHRNSGGTAWSIKAGDVDKWTPEHQLIWVTIDTSANPVYGTGTFKDLWRIDCKARTQGTEVSMSFDRAGHPANTYRPKDPPMFEIPAGSPIDEVRIAFCPPELE